VQETAEARPEEANTQEPLDDTFVQKDDTGAFDEPIADEEGTSPEADEDVWEDRPASKQMLDDPWQSDEQTAESEQNPRQKPNFSSSVLYRFLVNRKLEDTSGIDEL